MTGLGLGTVLVSYLVNLSFMFALNVLIGIWILCMIISIFINEDIKSNKNINLKNSFVDALKELRNISYVIPGMTLQTLSITILVPLIPKFFIGKAFLGLSKLQYGLVLAAVGGLIVVSMIIFGKLSKKIKVENMLIYGLLFTSIGIFALGNSRYLYFVMFFAIIAGISYSAVLPSWNAIVSSSLSKDNKGIMWGMVSTLEGLGRAVGPLIGGILGSYVSMRFSFSICSLIIFVLSAYYYIFRFKIVNN